MKRVAWLALAGLILAVVAVAASGYVIRALLEGSGRDSIVTALAKRVGVAMEVKSAEFDVAGWYRLRPALTLGGVRLGNPAGFTGPSLLEAKQLQVRVALRPLLEKRIAVESLTLLAPVLTVERNREGISNLERFVQGLSGGGGSDAGGEAGGEGSTLAIDELRIEGGEVRLPDSAVRGIELDLKGFAAGVQCEATIRASPSAESTVSFVGKLGPFGAGDGGALAMDGKLSADVALASIPEAVRRREFGELLASPGAGARVALRADLRGDLYGALAGPARLTLRDVMVGRDGGTKLRLDGEVPMQASVRKALSTPLYDLRVRKGSLRMGGGEWRGDFDLLLIGGVARAKSTGAIVNVEMNSFLSAFTRAEGKVQGVFAMPAYTLRFSGKDAAGIRRSLSGGGNLAVEKGRLKQLDLLAAIRDALEGTKGAAPGDTEFTALTAEAVLGGETLRFSNIILSGPALEATGAGSITFAQALDFQLGTQVRGRVAELLGKRASEGAPAAATVPMKIGGTVDRPRVFPDLGRLARETGAQYAEKVIREKVLTEGVKDKVREKLDGLKLPFPFGGKKKDEQR